MKGAGRADVMIVGHPRVEKNQGAASLDLAPSRQRRVNMQFGNLLPAQGPDARLGVPSPPVSDPAKLASGHLAVTRPVADGERLAIGGTEFVFIHAQGDTDDSLSVWIPELSTVVTNVTAKQFFAMYTLRGEPYRDPRGIIEGYDDIRALQPEHYVPMHGDAVSGAAEINRILTAHRDAYAFTFNQAIRGINKGWGPDELVANTHLPEHLRSEPTLYQGYSEFDFALRGIYRGLIGWYGEDAAEMHPPSPAVLGATIVEGFGGRDRLLARVGRAMEQRQYALAAKLAGYAVAAAPEDAAARTAKAAALRKLAQVSWGTQGYNFYLTEALHLEGKIDMHKSPAAAATRSYSGVAAAPTAALVSVLESRIDPERSRHVEKALAIRFRDTGEAFTIAVRRGVAETRPGAAADALHLETDRRSWFELTKRIVSAEELVREGRISAPQGQVASLAAFLELFDAD
ncbi:hypothetical protein LRS10_22900 [Phenylobacterium sp. J426]|uniref:alkyl sulfatase dimerization domain-containing protein n=1 Tax=Phenylobacterium sp. J426 TaxID=2898439 RepID=UPI0021507368|nr:alkyl sulfatase dimerization domain-containing protein [Phenylobacterium sp. J426]MCR5876752.1 hypothetical protein [Phenylobacterium sp. J426]